MSRFQRPGSIQAAKESDRSVTEVSSPSCGRVPESNVPWRSNWSRPTCAIDVTMHSGTAQSR